ncbi:SIS domain-containing protein [Elusimicrobiota bacterium]
MKKKSFDGLIRARIVETIILLEELYSSPECVKAVANIADAVVRAIRSGKRVFVFGNGGSAADAQHLACELAGGFLTHKRPPYDVTALSTNTSALTAIGNDYAFSHVFARQVQAHVRRGDVVIGISTSGNSANVISATKEAGRLGAVTCVMTGKSGGKLKKTARICFRAPSASTPRIQEVHEVAIHAICEIAERALGHLR